MKNTIAQLNKVIGHYMAQIILGMVFVAYFFPLFDLPGQGTIIVIGFAILSFTSSLGTTISDFINRLKNPWLSVYLLLLVHVMCPFVAFLLGHIFYPQDQAVRLGLLISGSVPMATTSLMWTALSKGSVSLAVLTVSIGALISPIVLPLCFFVTVGKTVALDYVSIILQMLVMATIPSLLGMLFTKFVSETNCDEVATYLNPLSKFVLIFIMYLNISTCLHDFKPSFTTIKLLFVVFIFVSVNYLVGYVGISILQGKTFQERIAGVFCCGLRNNGFAMLIAITYFESAAAIPIVLAVAAQQPIAGVVSNLILRHPDKNAYLLD
ncbi:MAG: bile acid:sodium symporter [Synergistaceae bacterium]|jgi:predicted Na+-dependent transporter|nr:bile acid:sodium symporter [Synergistaceae bacterium]